MRLFLAAILAATATYAQHPRMSPEDQKALQGYDLNEGKVDKRMAEGKQMRTWRRRTRRRWRR